MYKRQILPIPLRSLLSRKDRTLRGRISENRLATLGSASLFFVGLWHLQRTCALSGVRLDLGSTQVQGRKPRQGHRMWPLSNSTRVLTDIHSCLKQNFEALPISSVFSSLGFPYEDKINTPRESTVDARALGVRIS